MPLRICACTRCPRGHPAPCGQLYPARAAPGQRCPPCHRAHQAARDARPPTAARGYDARHKAERDRHLTAWQPGQPCAICHHPTWGDPRALHLAHNAARDGYLGLAHPACNSNPP